MIDNAEGKESTLVLDLLCLPWIMDVLGSAYIREAFKYYLADFVRRKGGGYLPIRQKFLAQNIVRKGVEGIHAKNV